MFLEAVSGGRKEKKRKKQQRQWKVYGNMKGRGKAKEKRKNIVSVLTRGWPELKIQTLNLSTSWSWPNTNYGLQLKTSGVEYLSGQRPGADCPWSCQLIPTVSVMDSNGRDRQNKHTIKTSVTKGRRFKLFGRSWDRWRGAQCPGVIPPIKCFVIFTL